MNPEAATFFCFVFATVVFLVLGAIGSRPRNPMLSARNIRRRRR